MEKLTGNIEGKDQKKVNESTLTKYKIGGKTYSTFGKVEGKFNIGDNVDIEFEISKDKKFNNISKIKLSSDQPPKKEMIVTPNHIPKKDISVLPPLTREGYWENKEKRDIIKDQEIHLHGCINSSTAILKLYGKKNVDELKQEELLEIVQDLALKISKWIKEQIKDGKN